jgi:hypothetical protein
MARPRVKLFRLALSAAAFNTTPAVVCTTSAVVTWPLSLASFNAFSVASPTGAFDALVELGPAYQRDVAAKLKRRLRGGGIRCQLKASRLQLIAKPLRQGGLPWNSAKMGESRPTTSSICPWPWS